MGKALRNHSKVYKVPRRPWEKERMSSELKIVGTYGLRNKREVYRARYTLAKIRSAARELLTLDPKDPRRNFEGQAILRRLHRIGILDDNKRSLDHVLGLSVEDLLKRRLQTVLLEKSINVRSIHHARVLIRHRHIAVGNQMVNVPGYLVRTENENHIGYHPNSAHAANGRPGRRAKRTLKSQGGGKAE